MLIISKQNQDKDNHKINLLLLKGLTDNVGKTTLINGIKNYFNDYTFHTIHYSNVKQESTEKVIEYSKKMYREMFNYMLNSIKFNKSGIICDRSHIGEMVYGPIYRNYSGEYVIDIEKEFSNIKSIWDNIFLITLYDEPENLIARDDGLSFSTNLEKKQNEINNFLKAHDKSTIKNKLTINIKNHNKTEALNAVINKVMKGK